MIKKNDNIIVITGADRGKTGKVLRVFTDAGRVLVEGINIKKKHQRARKSNEKGQILDLPHPLAISNVMLFVSGKRTRVGHKMVGGKKVRIAKKTGAEI